MAGDNGAPEEQGGARPRLTFYPPPQSRQLIGPCSADPNLDVASPWDKSSLPKSTGRASCHTLLLLEKKVKHLEEVRRKTELFHRRLQQQFLKEQERKAAQRQKAAERFAKSLEVCSRRSGKPSGPGARAAP